MAHAAVTRPSFVADLPAAVAPLPARSSAQVATRCIAQVQDAAYFRRVHAAQSRSRKVTPTLRGAPQHTFYEAGCSGLSMTLCQ
ncbi:hypothetical protein EYR26_13440 [Xanthomonas oryzae]|nr:hypothetical protein EYR26_13440 [Xanthomonas oryzae]